MEKENIITQHPVLRKCKQESDTLMNNTVSLAALFSAYAIMAGLIIFAFS